MLKKILRSPNELLSIASTAFTIHSIASYLGKVATVQDSAIIIGVTSAIVIAYFRGVVDHAMQKGKLAVIAVSLPFVLSWVGMGGFMFDFWVNGWIDSRYDSVKNVKPIIRTLEIKEQKLIRNITDLKNKLGVSYKALTFESKKSKYISNHNKIWEEENNKFKEHKNWNGKYWTKVKSCRKYLGLRFGSNNFEKLSECDYKQKLFELEKEDKVINEIKKKNKTLNEAENYLIACKIDINKANKDKKLKEDIEKKAKYDVTLFYGIMLLLGFYIEIIVTHAKFFFSHKDTDVDLKSATNFIYSIKQDEKYFLELLETKDATSNINATYAILLAWYYDGTLSYNNAKKYNKFKSPKTRKKYKFSKKSYYDSLRFYKDNDVDFKNSLSSYPLSKLIDVCKRNM